MKKTLLILTALASLTIAKARAQYYNFDVTVNQAPSAFTLDLHSSVGDALMYENLRQAAQQAQQQQIVQFRQLWLYQLPEPFKRAYIYFVPGLGKALKNNDWAAACTFFVTTMTQETAYIKAHHNHVSPGFFEAARLAHAIQDSKTGKFR